MSAFLHRDRAVRLRAEEALAPAATRAAASRGRARPIAEDAHRTCFERDRDRILHSKAFRRLKHKTQVWINPEGDHYVTRLTHALQVTQVARALAAALGLNEPLAEAIALGHDVGHTPFGHTGEDALEPYFEDGWHHAAQGVRIFSVLEDLNLTYEVRDGIRAHSWRIDPPPETPEGAVVRFADRIAYLSHDALDAMRAGMIVESDLPAAARAAFGSPGSQMIGRMIEAVVESSLAGDVVTMDRARLEAMHELREFMFTNVYEAPPIARRKGAAVTVVRRLVDDLLAHPERIPESYRDDAAPRLVQVADYVAGMTDRFALRTHDARFRPVLVEVPNVGLTHDPVASVDL